MQEHHNAEAPAVLSFDEQCRRLLRGPRAGDAMGTVVMLVLSGLAKLNFDCPSRYYMRHEDIEYEDTKTGARCYITIEIGDRLAENKARNFMLHAEMAIQSCSEFGAQAHFGLRMEQCMPHYRGAKPQKLLAEFMKTALLSKDVMALQFGSFAAAIRDNNDDATSSFRAKVLDSMAP